VSDWLAAAHPLVIGHRGASADAPENTLSAFALALEQGADGIELDVQLSTDGWPVVMHDQRVDRTTSGHGRVTDLTLAQLRSLDAGDGRPVPTLDEVFEAFGPALLYNLELKDRGWRDRGLAAAVADRIESHHLEDRVLVSSFNPLTVRRARRCLARRTPVAVIRMAGLQQYAYWLASGEADHPQHILVDNRYMDWAGQRGYRVHVWTVDDPAEAQRLVVLGVHAIITNKPDLIRKTMEEMA
jgi:glycerophosphoryl diester phosphodiesterase